jgi:hypothetical protein
MGISKQLKTYGFILISGIFLLIIGYFSGNRLANWSLLEKKTVVTNDIVLIKKIAEASVLTYHDVISHDFDNASTINQGDYALVKWWKSVNNTLNRKHLRVSIPLQASFGISLQDSALNISSVKDTLYFQLPPARLLSFDLNLAEKQVISEKGWLVFSDNEAFVPIEKYLYDREKRRLSADTGLIKQATELFKEKMTLIYKGLGKKVVWISK